MSHYGSKEIPRLILSSRLTEWCSKSAARRVLLALLAIAGLVLFSLFFDWRYQSFVIVVVQSLLFLGFWGQRARQRRDEIALRERENSFHTIADTSPSLIWMSDYEGNINYLNDRRIAFIGSSRAYRDTLTACVHPEDAGNVFDAFSNALKSHEAFTNEYRLRRQDGVYRWMLDVVSPRFSLDGSFAGLVGSAVDVTDQKVARETLQSVGGLLIAAQEKERSYLARELHDDICQRLAMLSLRIEKLAKGWAIGQIQSGEQLKQILQQSTELTKDVQTLSHQLHPSILDNLGLVTAVKSLCREVSEESGVVVEYVNNNIPEPLPREVSLSLFRVVQEALHNAAKYSGQRYLKVHLRGKSDELELEVVDRGVGFDTTSTKNSPGLGLVSMRERVHLLNGTINIDSRPNAGTRIQVRLPIAVPVETQSVALN